MIRETRRFRILIFPLLAILITGLLFTISSVNADTLDDEIEYPDVPVVTDNNQAFDFPQLQSSSEATHISDAIVSLNFVNAQFIDVIMVLTQQAGVSFILDPYWNIPPTGHVRGRQPGGPTGGGSGSGGFQPGGGWNPPIGGTGSVTIFLQDVTFDGAFKMLMNANTVDYKVFRATPTSEPLLYISSRERLETELGLGTIISYTMHYMPLANALDFLYRMDLLPSSGGFGFWQYNGQGGSGSGGSGGGGGQQGPGGGGGGFPGGGGGSGGGGGG